MPDAHEPDQHSGPYAAAAMSYFRAGWSPLPLPPRTKAPVPTGWTGARGATPSGADVHAWTEEHPDGNLALRLPPHVLGIDVDSYDNKPGGLVLAQLEQQLGALPPTWRSTSRDDGASGIRLYRIPEGLRWPGGMGPGIDTLRYDHRYAVAWPSVHPNGGTYRWITPDGLTAATGLPHPDDLPDLPHAWVTHFTRGEQSTEQLHAGLDTSAATTWLTQRGQGAPCNHMTRALTRGTTDLATTHEGGRHDAALRLTNRLTWLAGQGHTGALPALQQAGATFLKATAGARRAGDAEHEWDRMLTGAVDIAAAAHPHPSPDPCTDPFHGLIPKDTTSTPPTPTAPADTTPPSTATTATNGASAPAASADASPTPDADDLTELQINRNQAAAAELERMRAQRTAKRLLDEEDEDAAVADRLRTLAITERAQREWKRQSAGAQEPPQPVILTDLLATPDDPVRYRVSGLWPAGGRVVLAAAAKTGKSTAVGNLIRSLADATPFLDTFDVAPPTGRIILIDNELDPRQIKHWLRSQDITNTDNVVVVPLRGRLSTFDILDPLTRQEWARSITDLGGSIIIFDCLRPLIDALGLSEDKDAGRVLVAFDALLADSGADEGLVVHHMGHSGERSRGDTRIRDWPDAEWKLVRERTDDGETEDSSPRFFSAFGRDVAVPEAKLEFEPATRHLSLAGGNRTDAKLQPVLDDILDVLADHPSGMSERQIEGALTDSDHGRNDIRKARRLGIAKGLIGTMSGPRKALIHFLNDRESVDNPVDNNECATSAPPPNGAVNECATADPLKGGSAQWTAKPSRPTSTTTKVAHSNRRLCKACGATLGPGYDLIANPDCPACGKPANTTPAKPTVVERVVAGERVQVNLGTGRVLHQVDGETVDTITGEVLS